jgi:hypothetical protein
VALVVVHETAEIIPLSLVIMITTPSGTSCPEPLGLLPHKLLLQQKRPGLQQIFCEPQQSLGQQTRLLRSLMQSRAAVQHILLIHFSPVRQQTSLPIPVPQRCPEGQQGEAAKQLLQQFVQQFVFVQLALQLLMHIP